MTHQTLHEKALSLSQTYLRSEGELLGILTTMLEGNSFLSLGYKGLWDYCHRALKLSESQSTYFDKVAKKSITVPELKKEIQSGNLSLSKARRIEPVVTQE